MGKDVFSKRRVEIISILKLSKKKLAQRFLCGVSLAKTISFHLYLKVKDDDHSCQWL